jgi:hypothetical protein
MAEQNPRDEKSIEMRLAEIEDKLNQLTGSAQGNVSDEEMRAYNKVSGLIAAQSQAGLTPDPTGPVIQACIARSPIYRHFPRVVPRINRFVCECQCGPCACFEGGQGGFGGGFGGFGF